MSSEKVENQQIVIKQQTFLLKPRPLLEGGIHVQMTLGKSIESNCLPTINDPETCGKCIDDWTDFTAEFLRTHVSPESVAEEFVGGDGYFGASMFNDLSRQDKLTYLQEILNGRLTRLDRIKRKSILWTEAVGSNTLQPGPGSQIKNLRKVFIVHGHDSAVKTAVSNTLQKLGLEPIILHEQSNLGRTIIEKLEDHSDVGFAVVLLTPDDVGAAVGDAGDLKPRARQNVVLELGLFVGKLGRKFVCALHTGDLELPSDLSGLAYVKYDGSDGHWRYDLAKELRDAGLPADTNKL